MKKVLLVLFLGFYISSINAQIVKPSRSNGIFDADSTSFNEQVTIKLSGKTKFTDYKIISILDDTTVVDTTLTLKKDFKFNYLRKDNFELLPFHNLGQTFNRLGYNFQNNSLLPTIGANAKHYNYYSIEDIYYYEVPTPTSEVLFKSGLEQGQVLDAFLTMNTSRQFNFSLAYKGLRSLGKYRNTLASHGNFRSTFNYHSKNKNYFLKGHFSSFDITNDENGGLNEASVLYFENNDPNYTDRGRLDVNFTDATNVLEGKRYYFDQKITLFSKKNKIDKHNEIVSDKLKKYNLVLKKITNLKRDSLSLFGGTIEASPQEINKQQLTPKKNKDKTKKAEGHNKLANNKKEAAPRLLPKKNKSKIENTNVNLDSISKVYAVEIDSLQKLARIIKIDSTELISYQEKQKFDTKFGHSFMYETKHYRYNQTAANSLFGEAYQSTIKDHTSYQKLNNQFYFQLNTLYTGSLRAKVNYFNYNYHYNSILFSDPNTISNKIKGNAIAFGADWKTQYGKIYLSADASTIVAGDITGSSIKASAMFKKDSVYSFRSFAEFTSKTPDFNKSLFQSDYKDYNWQNSFINEKIASIGVDFDTEKWGSLKASYNLIDDYTYFDENSKPAQASETLNYLKVKASKSIKYGKFTLDNTVMYQKVASGKSFFRVPEIVTRNSLYYSSYVFKGKPMYLQTGVTLKYFTKFKANAYNPVLSEFVIQNNSEIGNFPLIDFFANAQISRTRIYFKVENLSASFTGRNYYSAPTYPYRDLTVRFGVVWNWFI